MDAAVLKSLSKKIVKSTLFRSITCWLAAQYMRLVWWTGTWEYVGRAHFDALYDSGTPAILGFWHGRLLVAPFSWGKPRVFKMLISGHRDGELIADTIGYIGIDHIKGSSTKGGASALRAMVKALRAGEWVGITPDGPRGPRMRVSDGVLNLARLSGAPILPFGCGVKRGKRLDTWDRFLIAWPFTKGVLIWGEPLYIAKDADAAVMEAARGELERRITELTREADRLTGRAPVEPEPAPAEHVS